MDRVSLEHIDPRNGTLVSGLCNEYNEVFADSTYNARKSNRFVPYRVCAYPPPITFGDIGEFLIGGEWLVCEFGGPEWWEESNQVGNSHTEGGKKTMGGGLGIHSPKNKATNSDRGKKAVKEGLGIHSPVYKQSEEYMQQKYDNGEKVVVKGLGFHSPEVVAKAPERARSTNSQRWMCLITGYVSSPGSLSMYQKARGIDTSKRVRLPSEELQGNCPSSNF